MVEGDPALTRCLESLSRQVDPPAMEVIVPWDDSIPEVGRLAERFPEHRFLALGSLAEGDAPGHPYTAHLLYDRRRAAGLCAARGRLLAMLEDRGFPRPDWARAMVELHDRLPHAAIGGVIENAATGSLRWALFFCDFGRYQPPLEPGDPEYVSDINVCYKRQDLEAVRELWEHRYQEVTVNWALRRAGRGLHLSERPVVVHERRPASLRSMLVERIHWGRIFGQVRAREMSPWARLARAASTPLLPSLLFLRHLRRQLHKRRDLREFVAAIPATLTLLHFWSLGELLGYLEAGLSPPRHTDP